MHWFWRVGASNQSMNQTGARSREFHIRELIKLVESLRSSIWLLDALFAVTHHSSRRGDQRCIAALQIQCGVNVFVLDSRRVLAPPHPRCWDPTFRHISNPGFGYIVLWGFENPRIWDGRVSAEVYTKSHTGYIAYMFNPMQNIRPKPRHGGLAAIVAEGVLGLYI